MLPTAAGISIFRSGTYYKKKVYIIQTFAGSFLNIDVLRGSQDKFQFEFFPKDK